MLGAVLEALCALSQCTFVRSFAQLTNVILQAGKSPEFQIDCKHQSAAVNPDVCAGASRDLQLFPQFNGDDEEVLVSAYNLLTPSIWPQLHSVL